MAKKINLEYELACMGIIEAMKVGQKRGLWTRPDLSFQIYEEKTPISRKVRVGDKERISAYLSDVACKLDTSRLPEPPGTPLDNPQDEAERIARFQAQARMEQRKRREQIAITIVGILNEPGVCFSGKPFHAIETSSEDPAFVRFVPFPGKPLKPIR